MKLTRRLRGQRGFTLIEILIVLAVLAILAAVVVPNVAGFLTRGKDRAWESDRRMLQAAVDSWRTDVGARAGNPWPTLGGLIGLPTDAGNGTLATPDLDYSDVGDKDATQETGEDLNSFVDIGALATGNYLRGADTVKSADRRLNTTATNTVNGSYGWYIDTAGVVQAIHWDDKDGNTNTATTTGIDVDAAEVTLGFVSGVYP